MKVGDVYINRYLARGKGVPMIQIIGDPEAFRRHGLEEGVTTYKEGTRCSLRGRASDLDSIVAQIAETVQKDKARRIRQEASFRWWLNSPDYPLLGAFLLQQEKVLKTGGLRSVVGMSRDEVSRFLKCMFDSGLVDGTRKLTSDFRDEMKAWSALVGGR